jgi:hypothetical protein
MALALLQELVVRLVAASLSTAVAARRTITTAQGIVSSKLYRQALQDMCSCQASTSSCTSSSSSSSSSSSMFQLELAATVLQLGLMRILQHHRMIMNLGAAYHHVADMQRLHLHTQPVLLLAMLLVVPLVVLVVAPQQQQIQWWWSMMLAVLRPAAAAAMWALGLEGLTAGQS